MRLLTSLVLLSAAALAAPSMLLAPSGPAVRSWLTDSRTPVYWVDDRLIVLDNSAGAAEALAKRGVGVLSVSAAGPLYLVIPQRPQALERAAVLAPVLYSDGEVLLVAADDDAAHRITLAGCQLVREGGGALERLRPLRDDKVERAGRRNRCGPV
ncbi:MAG: hypothetical protein R6X13_01370 [bacterium]